MTRARPVELAAWAATMLLVGCAASAFDQHFEAGQFELAARAHDASPAANHGDRTLYRLGLTYALPRTAVSDFARARDYFDQLQRRFPRSRYRAQAHILLVILDDMIRLQSEARQLDSMRTALDGLRVRNDSLRDEVGRQGGELVRLRADVRRLEAEVTERSLAIRRLQNELERLKSIDLGRPTQ